MKTSLHLHTHIAWPEEDALESSAGWPQAESLWTAMAQHVLGSVMCVGAAPRDETQGDGAGESPAFFCFYLNWLGSRVECPSPGSSR